MDTAKFDEILHEDRRIGLGDLAELGVIHVEANNTFSEALDLGCLHVHMYREDISLRIEYFEENVTACGLENCFKEPFPYVAECISC